MTARNFGTLAAALLVAAILLINLIWNPAENGPDISDRKPFLGCYAAGAAKLVLTKENAVIAATHQSTHIDRFFILKSDATINAVNNLELNSSGNDLRIGAGSTGFFYRFDSTSRPSALFIPDDGGTERALSRVPC